MAIIRASLSQMIANSLVRFGTSQTSALPLSFRSSFRSRTINSPLFARSFAKDSKEKKSEKKADKPVKPKKKEEPVRFSLISFKN